jgi:hypothetical protein
MMNDELYKFFTFIIHFSRAFGGVAGCAGAVFSRAVTGFAGRRRLCVGIRSGALIIRVFRRNDWLFGWVWLCHRL